MSREGLTLTDDQVGMLPPEADGRGDEIREILESSAGNFDKVHIELGLLLLEAQERKYYETWVVNGTTCGGIDDFCDRKLGFSPRKGRYLAGIVRKLLFELSADKDRLEEISWTKLREIVGIVTEETLEEWLTSCETMSVAMLKEKIREERGETDESDSESDSDSSDDGVENFTVQLVGDEQKIVVHDAMDFAEQLTSSDHNGVNLTAICSEFVATHIGRGDVSKVGLDRKAILVSLEKSWGIGLIPTPPGVPDSEARAAFLDSLGARWGVSLQETASV